MTEGKTILIIEDEEVILDVLSTKLKKEGYAVVTAKNGEEGIAALKKYKPSIVLLDIIMPKQDGYDVLRAAQKDASIKNIPIIIISNSGQPVEIDKALQLGAVDYLIKAQFAPEEVVVKIKQAFSTMQSIPASSKVRDSETKTYTAPAMLETKNKKNKPGNKQVLIVEDDQFLRELISKKLSLEGYTVLTADNGSKGYEKALAEKPQLILLDIIMPETNGFEMLERIRKDTDPEVSQIPIIMLSNLGQESDIQKGQQLGANDYLVKASMTTDEIITKLQRYF